jgi:redox-sensitive bicupin YhaK (pirin superfamily)
MLRYIDGETMGGNVYDGIESRCHFSFAEYYNPANMQFGDLRVLNDNSVKPGADFNTRPHKNMEVLSYVVKGELTHEDSMGNKNSLTRGHVQYMSAGTGIYHSEYNKGEELLRFLQIWILPDRNGHAPRYKDIRFGLEERINRWLSVASGTDNADNGAPIKIHADVYAFASILERDRRLEFVVSHNRQAYLALIEGEAEISGMRLVAGDALEITEQTLDIRAASDAHMFLIEMAKSA